MKCPNCSAELNDNARFCPQCGMPIDADNTGLSTNGESEFIPTDPGNSADIFRAADEERRYEIPDNDYTAVDYQSNRAQRRAGRHNQKPDHSKKKPLIIAIIALVLVIAIVLGVIFFVSRKTVSAKELTKAKENYLPPAQAVTIDTTLTDPSNDKIKFTYDDRARIISCTYSVNKMTYDQRYTYNNTQRKINVETTYRAHPIFTKELDYDRVTKPDIFEEVDGYYIRLSKEDLADTGATELPQETAAPEATEPPTEPPTEEPTEEPTDPPADWRELYIDYINNGGTEFSSGRLFNINDDDIPELFLEYKYPSAVSHFEICWINDDTVQHEQIFGGIPRYQERSGFINTGRYDYEFSNAWQVSQFDGSSFTKYRSGFVNGQEYKIDDEDVTKEEYEAALNEYKSWELMYAPDNTLTKIDALPDHIRNY
ncbi:zinc-ribbon domain-containing protein [Ruminococcus difficilis]|uniref:Zinc-ribbon domain-containing protein n=1 Tax=Ruminococcus difficilis TaxID=2763069 RepID=A0A934WTW0_9FIRM|nr:zinc-ribbon domain-containing protein [Ruminococcus difficilis]MBK6089840.1 zinc-ribbon domain-containing protein [Ruminococcus difficilis]